MSIEYSGEFDVFGYDIAGLVAVEDFDLDVDRRFLAAEEFLAERDLFRALSSRARIDDVQFRARQFDFDRVVEADFPFGEVALIGLREVAEHAHDNVDRPGRLRLD